MKKLSTNKLLIILLGLIIASASFYGIYRYFSNDDQTPTSTAETTSDVPSAQSDFTAGEERDPGNTINENEGSAIISDTGGSDESDNPSPISSASGEITVSSPKVNATLRSGHTISGTSKLTSVSYRVIDDVSGVITTGSLGVANGKFSGKIEFTTTAKEGRIDFYGTRPDLSEYSVVEIPVKFN